MSAIFSLFKSKYFYINLGLILATIAIIFFALIRWLSSYTLHGEYIQVPDFKGIEVNKLEEFTQDKAVSYQIIDSIYDPRQKPGIVLRQDPEADSRVKHNRTVYLSVTGMVPPQISMPKLIDKSERQARLIIGTYGLKVGHVTEKPGHCNGCVLEQLINGKEIAPMEAVKKGSSIDLVVGVKDSFFSSSRSDTTETGD
jgi:eukaryotic-like serine/threonine-protein kinase